MNKYPVRLAIPLLLSGVLFLTIAVIQHPKTALGGQSLPTQQTIIPPFPTHPAAAVDALTAIAVNDLNLVLTNQTGWHDTCDTQRMEISGIGMGDTANPINPQTLSLNDPANVKWLLAQVAGRISSDAPTPDTITFTTNISTLIMTQPSSNTLEGYTFETNLQPTNQITAFVNNPGNSYKTPRGLILYAKRNTRTEERWTSVGTTTNSFVFHNSHSETLTFTPLNKITDLSITAVVIDNQVDERPLILEAAAGSMVTQSVPITGPTDGPLLNIVHLTLAQVPTGTDQVSVTLRSPLENGDSLVLVGMNVSFRCGVESGADLAITKTVNNSAPNAGDIITYTVTVANEGPDNATGVQVSDLLPWGLTFDSFTSTAGTTYTHTSGLWEVGNLAKGANAVLTIAARVNNCTNGQTVTNTAKILAGDQNDPNWENNEVRQDITVTSVISCSVYLPIIYKDYCGPGTIYRMDNFSISNSGWITGNYSEADYSYANSSFPNEYEYRIYSKENNTSPTARSASPFGPFSRYTVKVDVKWAGFPLGDEYGIIFGIRDNDQRVTTATSLYRFVVNTRNNREFLLSRYNGSEWSPVVDWNINNSSINGNTALNTLMISCHGYSVDLYANNNLLWQGNLSTTCSGEVGVTSSIAWPNTITDARFDNFEVCGQPELEKSNNINTGFLIPGDFRSHPND